MSSTLSGKVCLVTGAAGRIGYAISEKLVSVGAIVVAVDLKEHGDLNVDWLIYDLSDVEAIEALGDEIKTKYGRIDCLVNNGALGGNRAAYHEKPLSEFEAIVNVNVRAPFLLSQMAIKLHIANPSAPLVIVNITSTAASRPPPMAALYGMSKAALVSLTKSIGKEYGSQDVRAIALSPGMMEVPNIQGFAASDIARMIGAIPAGRGGRPEEIANTVVWLAGSEATFLTGTEIIAWHSMSGQSLPKKS